jgi:hypothetical protein
MLLNEEFIKLYEELTKINSVEDLVNHSEDSLAEKFDAPGAEAIYGEEATTIEGVLRYFVEDIDTLAAIIERGRIKVSKQKETDTNSPLGDKYHKKRSFVSFSRQLFSHAYRAPKKWKFGIAVSQAALEKKVQQTQATDICPDFDHPGNNMMVFGAVKLADGTELLVTSFGSFIMNLNSQTRELIKQQKGIAVEKTDFYNKVKNFFDKHIEENSIKKHDKLISYTEDLGEVEKLVVQRRQLDSDIIEGFVLRYFCRNHELAPKFTDLYKEVPGLFEYLKEHTNLNEGEFRIWVDEGQQYLDISDCIVGIVLPSNYKENNYDDEQNTAADTLWLRKLVKEHDLTIYVYKSKDTTNIPELDYSIKRAKTLQKPSVVEYFHNITSSKEAVINFINNEMMRYSSYLRSSSSNSFHQMYVYAMAKNTASDQLDIRISELYNYNAFLNAINEYGFNLKDVAAICRTGRPLLNATEVFEKITSSSEEAQKFLQQLTQEFPDRNLWNAYSQWFVANTNAKNTNNILEPENIRYNKFISHCKQKYNYTDRDLTTLSKSQPLTVERDNIKNLFKAKTASKKAVLEFVKVLATEASKRTEQKLNREYILYMGKNASDTNAPALIKDQQYNYKAWLNKITDPKGTVKLTREEVLNYFKECLTNARN